MRSETFAPDPGACRPLASVLCAVHGLGALVPWLAGCSPPLAAGLSLLCLASLTWTLTGVPGSRRCPIVALACGAAGWQALLPDGRWASAWPSGATRVLPGLVVCRLRAGDRRVEWWVPRAALPAVQFRRLKVALRAAGREGLARIGG